MDEFIELNDRKLWVDGDSTITNRQLLYDMILSGLPISKYYVPEIDKEVKLYNSNNLGNELLVKENVSTLSTEWLTPTEYKAINTTTYILRKLYDEVNINNFTDSDIKKRLDRVNYELHMWEKYNLIPLLQQLIFIIDTFNKNNIIWGTGRGSSCCCYILYLIGLHNVDSILYELDTKEFFKE